MEIRDEFDNRAGADDGVNDIVNGERKALRARLNEIDALRKKEREARKEKDTEIKRVRDRRREIEGKLKELSDDLGAFRSVADIEEAIDRIMYKMETGGSKLSNEKATVKKLNQLEQAKSLLLELEPLQNEVAKAEDLESELMNEYREIHEKISQLNKEFESEYAKKAEKDKSVVKKVDNRAVLIKEREDIRAKLDGINKQIDALRESFDAGMKAWNEWREVAQQKFREKIEAERKEREARWAERERQRKLERKKARAAKKLNPFETEIAACATLIAYLDDRKKMMQRDKERAEIAKKVAAFDPKASAPKGTVLKTDEDDWLFSDRTGKAAAKPAKKPAAPAEKAPAEKKDKPSAVAGGDKYMQHSAEKHKMFELTKTEVPLTVAAIDATIKVLREKKKEYESHIKTDADIEAMTTSEDEEEEVAEAPAADAAPAAAAAAAPEEEAAAATTA